MQRYRPLIGWLYIKYFLRWHRYEMTFQLSSVVYHQIHSMNQTTLTFYTTLVINGIIIYHWTVSSPWQRCALCTFRNRLCHINVFVRVWIPQTNDVVGKHKCRYAMDQRICNLEIKQHQAISLTNCLIWFIAMFCIQNYHIYWSRPIWHGNIR